VSGVELAKITIPVAVGSVLNATTPLIEALLIALTCWMTTGWLKYAALRLGTFIMSYFSIIAAIALGLNIAGVGIVVGLVLALVPVAVFIAIRISGALAESMNPER
jgi:hypothetical protein